MFATTIGNGTKISFDAMIPIIIKMISWFTAAVGFAHVLMTIMLAMTIQIGTTRHKILGNLFMEELRMTNGKGLKKDHLYYG